MNFLLMVYQLPVLDRFAAQYDNPASVDVTFWQSLCKRGGMSGSGGYSWLNGWFNVFFPVIYRFSFCFCT
jgi:hypothetical protein